MAHFKRGKFRKSFKGHCTLCSHPNTDGTRRRRLTQQELHSKLSEKEERAQLRFSSRSPR